MNSALSGFIDLIFPRACSGCNRKLFQREIAICRLCQHDLPRCRFSNPSDNLMSRQFWGRYDAHAMLSFCFYSKNYAFSSMLYQLKYKSNPEVGRELGAMFARDQLQILHELKIDMLVPVPLHKSKRLIRGYNQSEEIAIGIAEVLHIPIELNLLKRGKSGKSQTTKSRWSRAQDISSAFYTEGLPAKGCMHVALVDDVFTTGSTAEACCLELAKNEDLKITILCLAFAWG